MTKAIHYDGKTAIVYIRDTGEHIQKHWAAGNFYEAQANGLLNYIYKNCQDCRVFYDIGASIGNHTVFFSEIMKAAFVLAVEPSPESFNHLSHNVVLCETALIKAEWTALGSAGAWGRTEVFGDANVGMTRFVKDDEGYELMTTLDVLVRDMSAPLPDFIKIDAEGWEKDIILGATGIIMEARPVVSVEVEPFDKLADFDKLFNELNYYREPAIHNHTPTVIYRPL